MNRKLLGALVAGGLLASLALSARAQQSSETPAGQDEITVPEGTEFKLQLHTTINSKTSKPGDRVVTTLIDPVAVEDRDILSKGVRIDGHLGDVKAAGRRGKGGYLTLVFDTIELPNGQKVDIRGSLTEIFASEGGGDPNVGAEGELKGHGASKKLTAGIIVASGALGAAGGLAPGIAAGSAGTVAALLLLRGKQASLNAGSLIGMRLDQDVSIVLPPGGK
jgi:hypothetical protein